MGGPKFYVKKVNDKALPYAVYYEGKRMKQFDNIFDAEDYENTLKVKNGYGYVTGTNKHPKIDKNERKNLEYKYPALKIHKKAHSIYSTVTKGLTAKGIIRKKGL